MSGYGDAGWEPPVGHYLEVAGRTAPAGYLACDGSAISRTTYARLFAAIGCVHGHGNGSNTFNLPNFAAADRLKMPAAVRQVNDLNNWAKSAGITVNTTKKATANTFGSLAALKSNISKRTGKYYIAVKAVFPSIAYNGTGYLHVGVTKSTSTNAATLDNDITSALHHSVKATYTIAGLAATISSLKQINNNAETALTGVPALSDAFILRIDFDNRTWDFRSLGVDIDNLQTISGSAWTTGDDWYPFIRFEQVNAQYVQFLQESELVANGGALADVTGYRNWFDDTDFIVGKSAGANTHTHTAGGTALTKSHLPSNMSIQETAAGNNTSWVGQVQAGANTTTGGGQTHTHTVTTESNLPAHTTALICIKYR